MKTRDDNFWMEACLALARRGAGLVSPNPMVGAVLVRAGKAIAKGVHARFGGPHAEVECLKKAKGNLSRTTLYVNLEPCSHFGKTPPCAPLIVRSGIGRVVVAMPDPNPLVSGRGIRLLRRAGVDVTVGTRRAEAERLNRVFVRHIGKKLPYVHLKIAQSMDGKISAKGGKELRITSLASQSLVHHWRATVDAVLVGAGTLLADDPKLTVRLTKGRDPAVVVVDGALSSPENANVFKSARRRSVYLFTSIASAKRQPEKCAVLMKRGVKVVTVRGGKRLHLKGVMRRLYAEHIGSVLVEAGPDLFHQFRRSGLVDEMSLFIAPRELPDGRPLVRGKDRKALVGTKRFTSMTTALIGRDLYIHYEI